MRDTKQIDEIGRLVSEMDLPPVGNEADWLGRLDKVMRDLRGKRADVMAELDGPVAGEEYVVTESRAAKRSYNTAAILSQFAAKDWTLHNLLALDAVRLSWRWSELRKAYQQAGVDLTVAAREVVDAGDVDEPPIGEVWSSQYRVEGKK